MAGSRKRRRARRRIWIWIAPAVLGLLVAAVALAFVTAPDVSDLKTKNPKTTALMRYRERQAQRKGLRLGRRQAWMPLAKVAPFLVQAVLISEDDKFYAHEGFDWEGLRDALKKNIKTGRIVIGGSTITQQLAKNLYLSPKRTPVRKIREAVIAYRLDRTLTKRRILELYLNIIEWGRGVYGIEAASQAHFGKPAGLLTLPEAVRLASVLPNPVRYRPETNTSRAMVRRRRSIAERMWKKHIIDKRQYLDLLADVDPGSGPPAHETGTARSVQPSAHPPLSR